MITIYRMTIRGLAMFGPMRCESCDYTGPDVMKITTDQSPKPMGLSLCPSCLSELQTKIEEVTGGVQVVQTETRGKSNRLLS